MRESLWFGFAQTTTPTKKPNRKDMANRKFKEESNE